MITQNESGKFNVKVYDSGFTYLTELINGEWKISEFNTEQEAEQALKEYNIYKEMRG